VLSGSAALREPHVRVECIVHRGRLGIAVAPGPGWDIDDEVIVPEGGPATVELELPDTGEARLILRNGDVGATHALIRSIQLRERPRAAR
jgi:hypothetical protein